MLPIVKNLMSVVHAIHLIGIYLPVLLLLFIILNGKMSNNIVMSFSILNNSYKSKYSVVILAVDYT